MKLEDAKRLSAEWSKFRRHRLVGNLASGVRILSSEFICKNGREHVGLVQRQEIVSPHVCLFSSFLPTAGVWARGIGSSRKYMSHLTNGHYIAMSLYNINHMITVLEWHILTCYKPFLHETPLFLYCNHVIAVCIVLSGLEGCGRASQCSDLCSLVLVQSDTARM